jgi:hypothetical protein
VDQLPVDLIVPQAKQGPPCWRTPVDYGRRRSVGTRRRITRQLLVRPLTFQPNSNSHVGRVNTAAGDTQWGDLITCRNRRCPNCQGNGRGRLRAPQAELLPVRYVHVIFNSQAIRDFSAPRSAFSAFSIPGTSWNLENELKDVAYLRRFREKDLKPPRVEILQGGVA